jgi:uncharacterized protein YcaQ
MKLSVPEARHIFLLNQGLLVKDIQAGPNTLSQLIQHLGYVQIDTLAVIPRAHHHTLWSRLDGYKESLLNELALNKQIFEYWSHAASYLPIEEYPFSLFRKKMYATGKIHWFKEDDPKMKKYVLDRIRGEGALQSRDFEHIRKGSASWFEWKPAKRALEQLFMEGKLMISERRNFQKVYDLAERVYPAGAQMKPPSEKEYCEHLILKAIEANGIVQTAEISYLRSHTREGVLKSIKRLLAQGRITQVTINGDGIYYGREENLSKQLSIPADPTALHVLSPFDNAVIQRKRLETFFKFDFFIECYVPEAKRRFGYFSLPVLYGDRFVARFDPKADRQNKLFYIKNWFSEKGWKPDAGFTVSFQRKIRALASFSGCNEIICGKEVPSNIRKMILG